MDGLVYEKHDYEYIFRVHSYNTYEDGFKTTVRSSSGHTILADEPEDCGGRNTGPNPIELLLASLVSCLTISLRIYSRMYGARIDKIEVFAEGSFDIRGFLGVEGFEKGLKTIAMRINIESSNHCDVVQDIIRKALDRWVVGSTIKKIGILNIETNIKCLERQ